MVEPEVQWSQEATAGREAWPCVLGILPKQAVWPSLLHTALGILVPDQPAEFTSVWLCRKPRGVSPPSHALSMCSNSTPQKHHQRQGLPRPTAGADLAARGSPGATSSAQSAPPERARPWAARPHPVWTCRVTSHCALVCCWGAAVFHKQMRASADKDPHI